MNIQLKSLFFMILVLLSPLLYADEESSGELIRIGNLIWDTKKNRSGLPWEEAVKYCLNKGMRLPSKSELFTHQVDLSKLEDDREMYVMSGMVHRLYWSSTESENDSSQAWQVNISKFPNLPSSSLPVRKSYTKANVRCVKEADKK